MEWCEDDDSSITNDGQRVSFEGRYSAWQNRLTGQTVANGAAIKFRNVQDAGAVIDRVTHATRDLVRIHGVSFNIDDHTTLQTGPERRG